MQIFENDFIKSNRKKNQIFHFLNFHILIIYQIYSL